MIENPYKRLPPIERRPDNSLYRMTPAQRKQANALIRRECCNCEDGNCIVLDDGDACTCPQTISFSVCCKFAAVLFILCLFCFCHLHRADLQRKSE